MAEEEILNKEIAEKLMQIKGETRGMNLKNDADFVLERAGKKGLKKVEEELEKAGCSLKYRRIRPLGFYPVGWRALSLLAIKKALGWGDREIRELGAFTTGVSLIVRLYMKFFHSIKAIVEQGPRIWDDYFTIGQFRVIEYDEKKKYALMEIRDFDLHPIFCLLVEGYFENIVRMVTKTTRVKCEEKKCVFRGNRTHQFWATW